MVVGPVDHNIQADIIFVIEGTAINGAYINDLKSNYIIPTLEYFSQGTIEEHVCESTSTLYGIVTYQAADCLPNLSSDTYGPYTSPQKVLLMLEKIGMEFVGGKGESHANIAEGLATALMCFEDLQPKRDPSATPQKHCVLVCNSPPYMTPVRETPAFDGHNVEQLAVMLNERNIHLSILSPRKIPALFKLYEKAGGDLPSQTKNYAKDPRHLVLLKGYSLKERPISPGPAPHTTPTLPISSLSSPLPNTNSPQPQPIFKPTQPPQQGLLQPQPATVAPPQATPQPTPTPPVVVARPPGALFPSGTSYGNMIPRGTARWPSMMPPQRPPGFPPQPPGGSALIAQLTQPPNPMVTAQFNKDQDLYFPVDQGGSVAPGQQGGPRGMGMMPGASPGSQVPPQSPQAQPPQPQQTGRERHNIWQGMLEWIEKSKTQNDAQKNTRHVPCQVSAHCKDGEPELKADSWPQKLIMQLMPKQLIGNIGGAYLKNSKSVLFHPQPCEALESLTKVMSSGFAGCVHFTSLTTSPCDIKVLILLYTAEKRAYLGFIPNDQAAFVDRLRKVIQNQKTAQLSRQGQGGAPGQNPSLPGAAAALGGIPQQGGQMGLMARSLGSMTQPQNTLGGSTPAGAVVNQPGQGLMQTSGQGNQPGGQQGGLQFNYQTQHVETARKQNLAKIEQLRQTLEAAQQQEQQFQKQIELGMFQNPMKVPQGLQDQPMDSQFKNQLEEQQKQQLRAQLQQQLQQQQQQQQQRQMTPQQQQQLANLNQQQAANQRMLRPAISNNPGLRHLLQQPQYRQQMPQMMQPMQRNANNPQQFDDSTFDFLN